MSRTATDWAWRLELKAPQKLLMLSLADRADEYHCCYPSIQRLSRDTGLDKKTIGKWVAQLIEDGLISDTGERKGPTKRVRVLRLNVDLEYTQKRDDSKSGNIPKNGCLNDPKFGCLNVPKKGCLNDPKFGLQNQSLEPVIEPNKETVLIEQVRSTSPAAPKPASTDGDIASAFESIFWVAGMRKLNKVKACSAFKTQYRLWKREGKGTPADFARMLADDIAARLHRQQMGFDAMHPTTYLNGKRWEDEQPADPAVAQATTSPGAPYIGKSGLIYM